VSSKKELAQAFAIRMRVFFGEQGVPEEIELDEDDRRAIHFLALLRVRPWEPPELCCVAGVTRSMRFPVEGRFDVYDALYTWYKFDVAKNKGN
jgi:predicted GNAT family N-acyltransferase